MFHKTHLTMFALLRERLTLAGYKVGGVRFVRGVTYAADVTAVPEWAGAATAAVWSAGHPACRMTGGKSPYVITLPLPTKR